MADFIKLTELYLDKQTNPKEGDRIFNKFLITNIVEDNRHNQSYITYEGKEVTVRESLDQINAKCAE